MEALRKAARVTEATVFAHNEPVIVVAKESASKVQSLRDLPGLKRLVLGTEEVPIGRYSLQILERAGGTLGADFRKKVEAKVVSREMNVRQVLAKVRLGEADAGIVYRTDAVTSKGEVGIVAIDPAINVIAEYPIAVVTEPLHPKLAAQWVTYVLSSAGQKTLQEAGFVTGANAIP
jgi:molybdate transport system substrate-binding protein